MTRATATTTPITMPAIAPAESLFVLSWPLPDEDGVEVDDPAPALATKNCCKDGSAHVAGARVALAALCTLLGQL